MVLTYNLHHKFWQRISMNIYLETLRNSFGTIYDYIIENNHYGNISMTVSDNLLYNIYLQLEIPLVS